MSTEVDTRRPRLPAAVSYGAAFYGSLFVNLAQSILLFRILGPARTGVWLVLFLLFDYGQHFHFGVNPSLNRQLPLRMGQGREEEVLHYAQRCAGLLALLCCAWVVLASGVSLAFYREHPFGAAAFIVAVILELWLQYHLGLLKTHSRFGRVGLVLLFRSLLNLGLLPMVMAYGLPGAFVRLIIMQLFALLLAFLWSPLHPRPVLKGSRAEILRDGFPLLAVALVFSFQFTINKALIAAGFGKAVVGSEYGLAAVGLTIMMVVPGALGTTSYPSMLKVFGAYGKASLLRARVLRHTLFVAVLTALAAALGWILLPPVVHALLPAYLPGVPAARWILPGVIFFSASVPSTYFLQTIRHQDRHLVVSLCALALQIGLVETVIHRGGTVVEVCKLTSLSYAIYGVVLFCVFLYGARERAS
ncbi:MAG TPA: hypothetical protein VKA63_00850 [Candidatus Krumholzibacteria bacterium]|nr:hypothetical protein [Candidatus Krumholzibacteria bacterium]